LFVDPERAGLGGDRKHFLRRVAGVAIACGLIASCASKNSDFVTAMGLTELVEGGAAVTQAQDVSGQMDAKDEEASTASSPAVAEASSSRPARRAENEAAAAAARAAAPQSGEEQDKPHQTAAAEGNSAPGSAASASGSDRSSQPAGKRGLFAALFGSRQSDGGGDEQPAAAADPQDKASQQDKVETAERQEKPEVRPEPKQLQMASLAKLGAEPLAAQPEPQPAEKKIVIDSRAVAAYAADALPGVRSREELFDIVRKSGDSSDDADIDLYEDEGGYQVAAAGLGLARLAPHGLVRQRPDVNTSCFKPQLVRLLKAIEAHYRKPVIVTSGYRSPEHNRRVRGARRSQHMNCAAADIQVEGVSRWELARFARSLPGRGGVGTYCHTASVHVDIGPERDWNWRCRR